MNNPRKWRGTMQLIRKKNGISGSLLKLFVRKRYIIP